MPAPVPQLSTAEATFAEINSLCKTGPPCPKHYPTRFDVLVEEIKSILGPSSGIDSSDVDVEDLKEAMRKYNSNERDWERFAHGDAKKNYTRNFVDEGNGKANLLVLVWTAGKGSPIHDHAGAHCIMKILKGSLKETLYAQPGGEGPLSVEKESIYNADQVAYISDDIGLHKIENPNKGEVAVSLHLYTPPWAAKNGCYIFEENGKKLKASMCSYYSVNGKLEKKC